jgi:hypothetical protein
MITNLLYPILFILPPLMFSALPASYRVSLRRKSYAFSNIFSNTVELINSSSHLNRYKEVDDKNSKNNNQLIPDYFAKLFEDIYDDLHMKFLLTLWEFTPYYDEAKLKKGTTGTDL